MGERPAADWGCNQCRRCTGGPLAGKIRIRPIAGPDDAQAGGTRTPHVGEVKGVGIANDSSGRSRVVSKVPIQIVDPAGPVASRVATDSTSSISATRGCRPPPASIIVERTVSAVVRPIRTNIGVDDSECHSPAVQCSAHPRVVAGKAVVLVGAVLTRIESTW